MSACGVDAHCLRDPPCAQCWFSGPADVLSQNCNLMFKLLRLTSQLQRRLA